jgi:hypothetical protein
MYFRSDIHINTHTHTRTSIASEYHWTAPSCSSYEHAQVSDARERVRARSHTLATSACSLILSMRTHAHTHTYTLCETHYTHTYTPIRSRTHAHMLIHAVSLPPFHKQIHNPRPWQRLSSRRRRDSLWLPAHIHCFSLQIQRCSLRAYPNIAENERFTARDDILDGTLPRSRCLARPARPVILTHSSPVNPT